MLLLALTALVMPAVFQLVVGRRPAGVRSPRTSTSAPTVEQLSFAVAIVLIVSYVAGLVFSLKTHRDLFNPRLRGGGRRAGACAAA